MDSFYLSHKTSTIFSSQEQFVANDYASISKMVSIGGSYEHAKQSILTFDKHVNNNEICNRC